MCFGSNVSSPRRLSVISLPEEEEEEGPMLLPPPDYSNDSSIRTAVPSAATPQNVVSTKSKFCSFYLCLRCRHTVPAQTYLGLLVSQQIDTNNLISGLKECSSRSSVYNGELSDCHTQKLYLNGSVSLLCRGIIPEIKLPQRSILSSYLKELC